MRQVMLPGIDIVFFGHHCKNQNYINTTDVLYYSREHYTICNTQLKIPKSR